MAEGGPGVFLHFKLAALTKASALADDVAKKTKQALDDATRVKVSLTDPAALAAAAEQDALDKREALQARQQRLDKRAGGVRRRGLRGFGGPGAGLQNFGDPDEALLQFAEGQGPMAAAALGARGLSQSAGLLLGGVAGGVVASLADVVIENFVRPFIREGFAALARERLDPIVARLDELERTGFSRQLEQQEDVARAVAKAEVDRAGVLSSGQHVRTPGPIGRLD